MTFTTAHLFAGAGGGLLADEILGHCPAVAIEIDPYACAVLRCRFPRTRVIESDIRTVDFAAELAGVDAICAGFPCQDISAANPSGAGLAGQRSSLFWEVIRAIDAVCPAWVFLENSPRIRKKGRSTVIRELVARGYTWRDGSLGASDAGAPHKRDRWWLLAKRADTDCLRELQPQGIQQDQRGRSGDLGKVRAGWWDAEPGMGRMANGLAYRSDRIRCLGNGQVPLVAAAAWCLLGGPR